MSVNQKKVSCRKQPLVSALVSHKLWPGTGSAWSSL